MEIHNNPMHAGDETPCTAFLGARCVAVGTLRDIVEKLRENHSDGAREAPLIFNDATGHVIEIDLRPDAGERISIVATVAQSDAVGNIAGETQPAVSAGPGRPKLGVVAREVTLLPRHWEWLNQQSGGASVALRKLVEEARRANSLKDRVRQSQEAAYRFMSAMAGDRPGFEEATRALFAGDYARFGEQTALWPADIRDYAGKLAAVALAAP